jgi:hypothetical protein
MPLILIQGSAPFFSEADETTASAPTSSCCEEGEHGSKTGVKQRSPLPRPNRQDCVNDLINQLSYKSDLSPDKSQTFADTFAKHHKSKLPASVAGEMNAALVGRGRSLT